MANASNLTHPANQSGTGPMAGIGAAPASVIGAFTGTKYNVSSGVISSIDTRDLVPLLHEGWQTASAIGTLTHPAGQTNGGPRGGIGTAPAVVIGPATGKSYTVSSNAISNVDSRDALALLHAGWV